MPEAIDVYLVRHGEACLPWSQADDAPLSERGHEQAEAAARNLMRLSPVQLISSPRLRARETAAPLGRRWNVSAMIDDRYREVPLLPDVKKRKAWVADALTNRWSAVEDEIIAWREAAWRGLLALERSAVIFTHFMLINAVVSRALQDERLVCFEPDYASITHLRLETGVARVVKTGDTIT